uniref:FYVE-type domain-containing protein n=1 Tax=Hyaloperonospora arabidopsidis (strain Emoy2) TaxID=559515 RepID=M4BLG9_HYAAE
MTRQEASDASEGFCPTTWTTNAWPHVELSTEEREKNRVLATQLLSNTLRDYDIYSADPRQRRMSRRRWKLVKSRDHISVYKERFPTLCPRVSLRDRVSTAFRNNTEWTEPKLLVATGWIEGTLDDVMYGVASPDAQEMLLKATVVKNKLINGTVLACIDAPCDADPFRFLGIKWFIKGPPRALQGIVQPRDLVFIEGTGITTRPNGERIGYQLLHSVDLPQYRNVTPQSGMEVTRGRISSCSIFREVPEGLGSRHSKVDVFVKGYVEAHGKLLDSVALAAASTGFMSSWNAVECANLKKLMWCFRQLPDGDRAQQMSRQSSRRSHISSNVGCSRRNHGNVDTLGVDHSPNHLELLSSESSNSCGTCAKRLGKLVNGASPCSLCYRNNCSRCRVLRTLKEVNFELWLRQKNVVICKRCVLQVDRLAAVDVARAEVQSRLFRMKSCAGKSHRRLAVCARSDSTTGIDVAASTRITEAKSLLFVLSPTADQPIDSFRGVPPAKMLQRELSEPDKIEVSDHAQREQIWSQMVELRMVAESIYKLTLETTESLNPFDLGE